MSPSLHSLSFHQRSSSQLSTVVVAPHPGCVDSDGRTGRCLHVVQGRLVLEISVCRIGEVGVNGLDQCVVVVEIELSGDLVERLAMASDACGTGHPIGA